MSEAKKTKSAPKTVTKVNKGPRIYIGPNLLPMIRYTVIADEIPVHIKDLIDKCPAIEKLIVDVKDMAQKEKNISKKGTLEHRYYQEIVEFAKQIRKGE